MGFTGNNTTQIKGFCVSKTHIGMSQMKSLASGYIWWPLQNLGLM